MANKKIAMNTLRKIIQLKAEGVSNKMITALTGISRTTVLKYVRQLEEGGFSFKELNALNDAALFSFFEDPENPANRFEALSSQFSLIARELKRVGVTRYQLWHEYKQQHPGGYEYSQFCYHYQQWCNQQQVSMHFEHKAGDKMFVDYTGSKLFIVDRDSGEEKAVEVFVAVLGASQYTFVQASLSQKKEDFISSLAGALEYFEGVPCAIVPDNLKSAVTRANRYEPRINESLADFAVYYQTAIVPARPAKPKDKSLVEGAVNIVYRRIFAVLRNQRFFSLDELNRSILELLIAYNEALFQGKDHSRRFLFLELDKPALKPLPTAIFQLKQYKYATVQKNSHIWLGEDKHYYSVPFRYAGKKVKVVYTNREVEVYYQSQRIAFHRLSTSLNRYVTQSDHMPSSHRFLSEWNPEHFIAQAEQIGEPVKLLFEKIFQSKSHPEQAYKSCQGILSLKKTGTDRLIKACQRALHYETYTYFTVKNILDKGLETMPVSEPAQLSIPLHENIRGPLYYQ